MHTAISISACKGGWCPRQPKVDLYKVSFKSLGRHFGKDLVLRGKGSVIRCNVFLMLTSPRK